jgi:hypothetical protein
MRKAPNEIIISAPVGAFLEAGRVTPSIFFGYFFYTREGKECKGN